jgi:hypothetical protein
MREWRRSRLPPWEPDRRPVSNLSADGLQYEFRAMPGSNFKASLERLLDHGYITEVAP